jgi:hypothetical protein
MKKYFDEIDVAIFQGVEMQCENIFASFSFKKAIWTMARK